MNTNIALNRNTTDENKTADMNVNTEQLSWIEISTKAHDSALNGIWHESFINMIGFIDENTLTDTDKNILKEKVLNVINNADIAAQDDPGITDPANNLSDNVQNLRKEYSPVLKQLIPLVEQEDANHVINDVDKRTGEDKRDLFAKISALFD